jgi:hypothetical protein
MLGRPRKEPDYIEGAQKIRALISALFSLLLSDLVGSSTHFQTSERLVEMR